MENCNENEFKIKVRVVRVSLVNLTMKAMIRYADCNCQDTFEVTEWLTCEEILLYKRLVSRQDALLVAIKEYSGLTFSKSNGYPDFSHINTSVRRYVNEII